MGNSFLKNIYNDCDPFEPASQDQYLDCTDVRGGGQFVGNLLNYLKLTRGNICALFTGHIGSGKSTELKHLERRLQGERIDGKRYFPVFIDVDQYLDQFDVDTTDIILAMITEVSAVLKLRLGIDLSENYFSEKLREIGELLKKEIESDEGQMSLFGAKLKIQGLKRDPNQRKKVRDALGAQPTRLIDEANHILRKARDVLKKNKECAFDGLMLIVDNLEKIRVVGKEKEGIESQIELFIERAPQLTALEAHVVYTVPLRLARQFGPELGLRYDKDPFVLPMVKTRYRDGSAYEAGITSIKTLIQQRLGSLKLSDVFDEEALSFLIKYSGGNPRHLFLFIQASCVHIDDLPITRRAAEKSIAQTIRSYATAISSDHWALLVQLDASERGHIENNHQGYMSLLENQSILEYLNGGDEDIFATSEPWYAVHPIVRELSRFKEAYEKLKGEALL